MIDRTQCGRGFFSADSAGELRTVFDLSASVAVQAVARSLSPSALRGFCLSPKYWFSSHGTRRSIQRTMASGGVARNTLETLKFVNGALKNLPVDSIKENYVRSVPGK